MSNLLDNALTALESADDKVLSVSVRYAKGNLFINVVNSYSGTVREAGGRLLTLKKEQGHGLGVMIVEDAVQKLGGTFSGRVKKSL